ncbi:MAG TPA: LCP family protein, partial [Ktedonobacteraceae bacterium]
MNDQFPNNRPVQSPQTGQQGAPSDYYSIDEQDSVASHQGAFFRNSVAPYSSTPSTTPKSGQNQSSPPSQFKGLFARPASIAPELASRKYTDPLLPPANMPGDPQGQAPTNVTYAPAPPAMGAPASSVQQLPFQTSMPGTLSVPPGFGPGFSTPDVAQPWSAQSPARTPNSIQEALEAFETIPTPAQKPSWQSSSTQSPPWQNAPTQNPPWQSSPAQNPFWGSAPAENPSWQNAPAQNPPWKSSSTQSPPWQNAPAQNVFSAQGNSTLYPPNSQPGSGQRNTPPPQTATRLKGPKKRGLPIWSRVLIGVLVVFLVLGGSAYAYYQVNYAKSISAITNQQVVHHNAKGQVVTATPASADVLTGGRLNILLLGSDTDGKSAAPLAQTDIIVTIDPQTKYVGMLSIPRDLRLYAPKVGAVKLDEAFSYGWQMSTNANDSYANAVGMSIDTIEQNFGIPINYSAWVGLDGFVKVIDTVGGIDVDVLHPMVDDVYPNDVSNQGGQAYDYKRLYIAPG